MLPETAVGFADISIVDLAEDYQLTVAEVLRWCDHYDIPYRSPESLLALEDAKKIILAVQAPFSGDIA
ncbi:hypothetical protein [Candidatus Cyanaurora vandensis]|uniref:hypothetical protein n=1 Tax=Candidatus Cyanaurora vandensis TaxID=2714958 RepID=UPI002580E46E|nr:hypothetical protein [Candidatus Cyanaurora vandensis]